MNIFIVFCVILVPSLASKEYTDEISQLLDDPDLILELVKRLGNEKASPVQKRPYPVPDKHPKPDRRPYVPLVHTDARTCRTRQFKTRIIKTEDSIANGATFLRFTGNVTTNEECLSKCCAKSGCDLAVYENKTKHNCYLFKCRDEKTGNSTCEFDIHDDYISTTLTSVASGGQSWGGDNVHTAEEDDLGASLESITQKTKDNPPKPTPRPTQLPHSVALGNWCELDVSCEDPHAVCFQRSCRCELHYQQKDGVCRESCGADQVACEKRGTGRLGPDCIPRSQICDGVTQCADGGDERGCPGYPIGSPPSHAPSQDGWDEKEEEDKTGDSTSSEDDLHSVAQVKPSPTDSASSEETDVAEERDKAPDTKPGVDKEEQPGSHSADHSKEISSNPDNTDTDKDSAMTDKDSSNSDEDSDKEPETDTDPDTDTDTDKDVTDSSSEDKTATPPVKVEVVGEEEEVFVSKEKVIVASPTDGAQGPIVALSLGLAITLMLLVFVGCRLRNVRHRLRKGRPLHSNEADYLINGMYL